MSFLEDSYYKITVDRVTYLCHKEQFLCLCVTESEYADYKKVHTLYKYLDCCMICRDKKYINQDIFLNSSNKQLNNMWNDLDREKQQNISNSLMKLYVNNIKNLYCNPLGDNSNFEFNSRFIWYTIQYSFPVFFNIFIESNDFLKFAYDEYK